ncbi:hypothetical protein JI735_08770 [Paenibacillus sonchi]|uniref:Uncharacterized protein n=1 Tax=Paenibacillus sonchi TaxID=373687 RepID=A0A974PFV5_9BACL|nr:hypothetical protein JI735_08770 [Paenibacillus sonchi]
MRVRVRKQRLAADRPSFGQALGALSCEGFRHRLCFYGGCARRSRVTDGAARPLSLRESLDAGTFL